MTSTNNNSLIGFNDKSLANKTLDTVRQSVFSQAKQNTESRQQSMLEASIQSDLDTDIDKASQMAPKSKGKAPPVIKKKATKDDDEWEEAKLNAKKKDIKKLKEVFENDNAVASLLRRCDEIKAKRNPKLSIWYAGSDKTGVKE